MSILVCFYIVPLFLVPSICLFNLKTIVEAFWHYLGKYKTLLMWNFILCLKFLSWVEVENANICVELLSVTKWDSPWHMILSTRLTNWCKHPFQKRFIQYILKMEKRSFHLLVLLTVAFRTGIRKYSKLNLLSFKVFKFF